MKSKAESSSDRPPKKTNPMVEIGGRTFLLKYDCMALYRMGTCEHAFELADIGKPTKCYAALLAWVWACLPDHARVAEDGWAAIERPEHLVPHITMTRVPEVMHALSAAVALGINGDPNAESSTASAPGSQSS